MVYPPVVRRAWWGSPLLSVVGSPFKVKQLWQITSLQLSVIVKASSVVITTALAVRRFVQPLRRLLPLQQLATRQRQRPSLVKLSPLWRRQLSVVSSTRRPSPERSAVSLRKQALLARKPSNFT